MNKDENRGLSDNHDGEFILNESGTSVTIDADTDFPEDREFAGSDEEAEDEQTEPGEA